MIDGVAWNFHHQIFLSHKRLARQTGIGLQAPSTVQQIFFVFIELIKRCKTLTHDDVAGGASAAHVAGVFDVDVVLKQGFADAVTNIGFDLCALRADFDMGEDFDDGHGVIRPSQRFFQ